MGLGTLLLVAGTGLAAAGQIQAGKAAEREAKNAAVVSEHNARIEAQKGEIKGQRFDREAVLRQREGKSEAGRAASLVGLSGTVGGTGSNLTVAVERAKKLEEDRQTILADAANARAAGLSAATGQQLQASSFRQQGRAAKLAGFAGAGATALTGFGKLLV